MKQASLRSILLAVAVLPALLVSGCSDSPSDVVLKDFHHRKYLTGAALKKDMGSASTAEKTRVSGWTDNDFEHEAKMQRAYLIAAEITIDSEEIAPDGKSALVRGVIRCADHKTLPFTRKLFRDEHGGWRLLSLTGSVEPEEKNSDTGKMDEEGEDEWEEGEPEEEDDAF